MDETIDREEGGSVVNVQFSANVDTKTLTNENIKIESVSLSVGSAGQRNEIGSLIFEYNTGNETLNIKSEDKSLGGCTACGYELIFSDRVLDTEGNTLEATIIELSI